MERWFGRVALLTGSSGGMGIAIATELVKHGMIVIGIDKNIERTELLSKELESFKGQLVAMKCNVRDEDNIKSVFSSIKSQFGGIDVCINNAGLNYPASLLNGDTEEWKEMLEVNVLAYCIITREFMSQIKERGVDDGHIVFMNSLSSHINTDLSNLHFYTATKHAVKAITEGLRQELREIKSNCRITAISPGVTLTPLLNVHPKGDEESIQAAQEKFAKKFNPGEFLMPEDIAGSIVFALSSPPRMEVNDIIVRPTCQID